MKLKYILIGENLYEDKTFDTKDFQEDLDSQQKWNTDAFGGIQILKSYSQGDDLSLEEQIKVARSMVNLKICAITDWELQHTGGLNNEEIKDLIEFNKSCKELKETFQTATIRTLDYKQNNIELSFDEGYCILDENGYKIGTITNTFSHEHESDESFEESLWHYIYIEKWKDIEVYSINAELTEYIYIRTLDWCRLENLRSHTLWENILCVEKDDVIELYNLIDWDLIFSQWIDEVTEIISVDILGQNAVIVYFGLNHEKNLHYIITTNQDIWDYSIFTSQKPNIILWKDMFVTITYNPESSSYFIVDSFWNSIEWIISLIDKREDEVEKNGIDNRKYYIWGNLPKYKLLVGNYIYIEYIIEQIDSHGNITHIKDNYSTWDTSEYHTIGSTPEVNIFSPGPEMIQ